MNYKNIYEYFDRIYQRPWMYLWKLDIQFLHIHSEWYRLFFVIHWIEQKEEPSFRLFHDYIAVILWYESSTAWWANMLNEYYKDPKIALDKFFEHLDDFKRDMKWKNCLEIWEFLKSKWYELHYNFSAEFWCR